MVHLYDTTLRDGAQQEGISFSVADKLKIAQKLAELGIHYVEGGWPGANPKDSEFFRRARHVALGGCTLVAFGSTKHPDSQVAEDPALQSLLSSGAGTVAIVGKSWDRQVTQVLETTLDKNLAMIADSIAYLKSQGLTVFFDAEHFFDGYKSNQDYALKVAAAASDAGVDVLVLCDTNGGALPQEVAAAVTKVKNGVRAPLGIHAHNDSELAVANSLAAVSAGATQVQGTMNGYGERCGNANLCSIIPNLKLKLGIDCVSDERLGKLSEVSRYVAELANMPLSSQLPYVGACAFAHKAGLHVSGIMKWRDSYQHTDPGLVGNLPRVVVSELSGKGNIIYKARERGLGLPEDSKELRRILDQVKLLESQGFQYEAAEASFELLLRRSAKDYQRPFELVDFMVVVEKHRRLSRSSREGLLSEATVKVKIGGDVIHTAAEGNGPVNALDQALRKALVTFYPGLAAVKLVDYKVRILDEAEGTESQVRVLIESSDGRETWRTVGSSTNIIEASWLALADGLEYWLTRHNGGAEEQVAK